MPTSYRPKPHALLAQSRQGMPWWKALAEMIDNCFDANATRVVIETSSRSLTGACETIYLTGLHGGLAQELGETSHADTQ